MNLDALIDTFPVPTRSYMRMKRHLHKNPSLYPIIHITLISLLTSAALFRHSLFAKPDIFVFRI